MKSEHVKEEVILGSSVREGVTVHAAGDLNMTVMTVIGSRKMDNSLLVSLTVGVTQAIEFKYDTRDLDL